MLMFPFIAHLSLRVDVLVNEYKSLVVPIQRAVKVVDFSLEDHPANHLVSRSQTLSGRVWLCETTSH